MNMPYDIMVGIWVGTAVSFSPKGEPVSSGLSRNIIYWHQRPETRGSKGLLHFRQDQGVAKTGAPVNLLGLLFAEYDLEVNGKYAESVPDREHPGRQTLALKGTETRPDVYHFDGEDLEGEGKGFRWYNSHYFTSRDERHIMGPVVSPRGEVGLIHVQIFTRIAYDVPRELQYDLHT
jgi:hypothetical protein